MNKKFQKAGRLVVSNPAQLPGPLAWLQAGKGKRPGSAFSSSLIFFFFLKKEKSKSKKVKGTFPGYTTLLSNELSTREGMRTSKRSYLELQDYLHI